MGRNITLIGVYPPPFGGATVKCKLLSTLLITNQNEVDEIDLYEINRRIVNLGRIIFKCIKAFCSKNAIVYCSDSKRLNYMLKLQSIFPKSYRRTTIVAIGGMFHNIVSENNFLYDTLKKVKGIWVESEGMKKKFIEMGFSNVLVFPNPKPEKGACQPSVSDPNHLLRLVFFSRICKEKGVNDIIEMVKILEKKGIDFKLDFYGHVNDDFADQFYSFVDQNQRANYCGVFDSTKSNLYEKLNSYDLLLLPTYWVAEGVPGILVEAKMAGIAVIASDCNYNTEIIREEGDEGFIIRENYSMEMAEIVRKCVNNRELLNKVKEGSFKSRKRYSIEEYEYMASEI